MKKIIKVSLSVLLAFPGLGLASTPKITQAAETNATTNATTIDSDWSLVWSDEFDGAGIDPTKWSYDIGNWMKDSQGNPVTSGWGNNEKEYYTDSPENSYIKDGNLVIEAKKEQVSDDLGTYEYTSAKLKTKNLFSKKYGRYEIRAKLPTGKGFWPAIWMLPEDDKYGAWAASGEIDIAEGWGSRPNTVAGTLHYGESWPNNKYTGKEYTLPTGNGVDQWHTYALEWEPGEIRWYVDGELYQTQNNWYSKGENNATKYAFPAPFDQEFYLILNLAVGGNFDGDPDQSTNFPSQMAIDYVRVYDLTGRDYQQPVEPALEPVALPDNAKQPLPDGNFIYDNQYENPFTDVGDSSVALDPLYWNFVHLPDFGGAGSVSTETVNGANFSKISIDNPGAQLYSLQQIQNLSLGKGGKYKVSFDAKSTGTRKMMVKLGAGASRGWVKYSNEETFTLSDQVQSYEFTFDMLNDTDIESRLEFNLGGNGTNPVWIGNVRVEDITGAPEDYNAAKQPLPDGNLIYNGTFDQGTMDRMTYWNFVKADTTAAVASVDEATRELHVAIENGGSEPNAVQVNQKGMDLVKGNDYQVTFKARSTEARTIQVDVRSQDGTTSYSEPQTIDLTPSMEEKTVTFTMPDTVTDENGQFIFNLGGQTGDVYLDDVRFIKTSDDIDYGNIDLFPLKNGNFDEGLTNWGNYIHNDANAQVIAENGEAKVAIENEGNETWSVMLMQENMSLAKDVTYEVSFDARSTKPRDIEVTVENAQYTRYFDQIASLTDQMQSYTFEMKMPKDDVAGIKFQLGKSADSPLGAHDVFIDNVVVKVKGMEPPAPTPSTTPGIDNGTFDTGMDHWSSWWGDQWSGVAEGTATVENGELKVDVTKVGGASYAPQIFQKDITFEKGKTYKVSFDARSNEPRKVNVNIGKELTQDPWFTAYAPTQTFDLTNEMQTFTYTFEMNEETFNDGKMVFELGNIADGNAATTVYLDNVSITPELPAPTPELDNGTFDAGMDHWSAWWGDQWSGVAEGTAAVENGELKVDITKVGGASYSPQIFQKGITFEKGKTYTVTFDARANEARKVNVNIGKELTQDPWFVAYAPTQTFDLTNEMQTFTYSFEMSEDTFNDGKIVFELGNIEDGNAATTVYLDNVSIAVDDQGENPTPDQPGDNGGQNPTPDQPGDNGGQAPSTDQPSDDNDQGQTGNQPTTDDDQGNLPETASNMYNLLLLGMLFITVGTTFYFLKRKKQVTM